MKPSALSTTIDYKAKYYELRRTVKELIFENSAYHNEITECHQKIVQRERERELLLQHLLQYEQEEWELQREMTSASTEKHRLMKKQQDADKRKRVRVDMHSTDSSIPLPESDTNGQKIPKIKIVFQNKVVGAQEPAKVTTVVDINSETKMAIKNKLKRNKVDPIVISLPSMLQNRDSAVQQLIKKQRPNNILLPFNNLLTTSLASSLMLSPSLASSSHMISPSSLGFSPLPDYSENVSDNTPIEVFSESENSCNVSPSNESGSDISHKYSEEKAIPIFDDNSNPGRIVRAHSSHDDGELGSALTSIRKPSEGFRISSSALRSIKQKIDSINANKFDQATLKAAASKSIDRLKSSSNLNLSDPKILDKGDKS